MDRHLLFFYGTLMSDHCRGNVLTGRTTSAGVIDLAVPVARGTIRGVMHNVGAFPALLEGDGVVHGEIWEAPTADHLRLALGITDSIEGYRGDDPSNLYDRIEVPLLSVEPYTPPAIEDGGYGWTEWLARACEAPPLQAGHTVLTYRYNTRGGFDRGFGPRTLIASGDWRDHTRRIADVEWDWSAA